jgi:ABC-type multidrug transport system permease subunit
MLLTIFIIQWLILGVLSTMSVYYTPIRYWYERYKDDYRFYCKSYPKHTLLSILFTILAGPVGLIVAWGVFGFICVYFKVPKNEKNQSEKQQINFI